MDKTNWRFLFIDSAIFRLLFSESLYDTKKYIEDSPLHTFMYIDVLSQNARLTIYKR